MTKPTAMIMHGAWFVPTLYDTAKSPDFKQFHFVTSVCTVDLLIPNFPAALRTVDFVSEMYSPSSIALSSIKHLICVYLSFCQIICRMSAIYAALRGKKNKTPAYDFTDGFIHIAGFCRSPQRSKKSPGFA